MTTHKLPLQPRSRRPAGGPSLSGMPYTIQFGLGVAPVRRTLAALTRRVHQICNALTADAVVEADLTTVQYGAMGCLNPKDGEPNIDQSTLAARLGIDRNSASLLVEDLASKGIIERRVNSVDRRARLLRLTPKGERLFARVRPRVLASHAFVLESLKAGERELLLDLLTRVIRAKGVYARPGGGRRKRGSSQSLPPPNI